MVIRLNTVKPSTQLSQLDQLHVVQMPGSPVPYPCLSCSCDLGYRGQGIRIPNPTLSVPGRPQHTL